VAGAAIRWLVITAAGTTSVHGEVVVKEKRRRDKVSFGDLVDSLGPTIIGAALVILLILMAWGCHSGTS
jgi:hypothetical protein